MRSLIITKTEKLEVKIINASYLDSKKDFSRFNLINFHPSGGPEASICCVAKDSK